MDQLLATGDIPVGRYDSLQTDAFSQSLKQGLAQSGFEGEQAVFRRIGELLEPLREFGKSWAFVAWDADKVKKAPGAQVEYWLSKDPRDALALVMLPASLPADSLSSQHVEFVDGPGFKHQDAPTYITPWLCGSRVLRVLVVGLLRLTTQIAGGIGIIARVPAPRVGVTVCCRLFGNFGDTYGGDITLRLNVSLACSYTCRY